MSGYLSGWPTENLYAKWDRLCCKNGLDCFNSEREAGGNGKVVLLKRKASVTSAVNGPAYAALSH